MVDSAYNTAGAILSVGHWLILVPLGSRLVVPEHENMESSGMLVNRHFVHKFRVGSERNIDPLYMNFRFFLTFNVLLFCAAG